MSLVGSIGSPAFSFRVSATSFSTKASAISPTTMMRLIAVQRWPEFLNEP